LNISENHHRRIIGWLEAKFMDKIANGFKGVGKRLQAWKVQDTYRTSKNVAMKRHVNKRKLPPCQLKTRKSANTFESHAPPEASVL
jgi:hypothetical protein